MVATRSSRRKPLQNAAAEAQTPSINTRRTNTATSLPASKKRQRRRSSAALQQPLHSSPPSPQLNEEVDAAGEPTEGLRGAEEVKEDAQEGEEEVDSKDPCTATAAPSPPFQFQRTNVPSFEFKGGEEEAELSLLPYDELNLPLRVFVGTYTGALYALESIPTIGELLSSPPLPPPTSASSSSSSPTFYTLFSHEAHRQSIHALTTSPSSSYLLTGGVDEVIQVFSLAPRPRHHGSLHRHYSSITSLSFPTSSHFLSASEEGTIAVFALPSFEAVTRLRGHRGSVQAMAVHETGKAAMTAGRDGVVRVWDLVKGEERTRRWMGEEKKGIIEGGTGQAYEPLLIQWRGSGASYVLARGRRVTVFNDRGEVVRIIEVGCRVLSLQAVLSWVLVGCEDGRLICYEAGSGKMTAEVKHEVRVRGVEVVKVKGGAILIVSASTDGQIQVWRLNQGETEGKEEGTLDRVAHVKGQMRVTAMCASIAWDQRREDELEEAGKEAAEEVEETNTGEGEDGEQVREPTEAQLRRKEKKRKRLEEKLRRGKEGNGGVDADAPPVESETVASQSQVVGGGKRRKRRRGGKEAQHAVSTEGRTGQAGHTQPPSQRSPAPVAPAPVKATSRLVVINKKRRGQ